jgi:16S rRNA (cytosine1402-N4)-methyltransferase
VHSPVLLREALDLLALAPGLTVVDGTVGAGGHASAMAARIAPGGRLVGLDRDREILVHARAALDSVEAVSSGRTKVSLLHLPYSEIENALAQEGLDRCDRVLLDLGVSSYQIDSAQRGFSFMSDGPLDMRMDRSSRPTAAEWLARVDVRELERVLREYGEERFARRIAGALVAARRNASIERTGQLRELVLAALPRRRDASASIRRRGRSRRCGSRSMASSSSSRRASPRPRAASRPGGGSA